MMIRSLILKYIAFSILTTTLLPSWEKEMLSQYSNHSKIALLKVGSALTDPICKVREYFYTFYILPEICPTTIHKVVKATILSLGMATFTILSPITTPLGMGARKIALMIDPKPFIYLKKNIEGKVFPSNQILTLASHNVCYMPAGYALTDGQVTPDPVRIDLNLQKIKELDPDVICLYEVPDICDACTISSKLTSYPFIIPAAGTQVIGPSSMMYIASKYEINPDSIEFIPFEKDIELTGRAKFSKKGFLSFEIKSKDLPIATIVSTHLQHSEIPGIPEKEEQLSRSLQMAKIINHIEKKIRLGKRVIFTGDLNQEEQELTSFFEKNKIDWLYRDPSIVGKTTWGGDHWCAALMNKKGSNPLVLDYTFVAGDGISLSTEIVDTDFEGMAFKNDASSDHYLLFNTISFQ